MALVVLALACSAQTPSISPSQSGPSAVSPEPASAPPASAAAPPDEECPTTPSFESPGQIPGNGWRDGFPAGMAWFKSTDNQTWTAADNQLWFADQPGYTTAGLKALWLKPVGSNLAVTGRRLGGEGIPTSNLSGGYFGDVQASGLSFSTGGCWEIEARAGDAYLRFVISVEPSAT